MKADDNKKTIEAAVRKIIAEYGDVLDRLGECRVGDPYVTELERRLAEYTKEMVKANKHSDRQFERIEKLRKNAVTQDATIKTLQRRCEQLEKALDKVLICSMRNLAPGRKIKAMKKQT